MIQLPPATVTASRTFRQNRSVVFQAISQIEFVQQWFKPDRDVRLDVDSYNFSPGGQYRFIYTLTDGTVSCIAGEFREIVPLQRVVFTWLWEAPDPAADQESIVTMTLHAVEDDSTRLDVVHQQLPSPYRDLFQTGWEKTLQHLAGVAQTLAAAER